MTTLDEWATNHARTIGRIGIPADPEPYPIHPLQRWVFDGHTHAVTSVALSTLPSGEPVLASSSVDGTVRLWDPRTGDPLHTLTNRCNTVTFARLSAQLTVLAGAGDDGTVRLWDPVTGQQVRTIDIQTGLYPWAEFATLPDGSVVLATGDGLSEDQIDLWEPLTGRHLRTIDDVGPAAVTTLPDGSTLLAGAADHEAVRVWDPVTGARLYTVNDDDSNEGPVALGVLPSGSAILANSREDHTVGVWDLPTGRRLHKLVGHTGDVWRLALASLPGGPSLLATCSLDATVRLWNLDDGTCATTLSHPNEVVGIALAGMPDGRLMLATGCEDYKVRVWDLTPQRPPVRVRPQSTWTAHSGEVSALAFGTLPDGSSFLASSGDFAGTVPLWDPATGRRLHNFIGHVGSVTALAVGSGLLASAHSNGAIMLWDPASGRHQRTLSSSSKFVRSLAFVTRGDTTVLAGSDGIAAQLWGPATGALLHHPFTVLPRGRVGAPVAAFVPGANPILASGGVKGEIWLTNPSTDQLMGTLRAHEETVRALAAATTEAGSPLLASSDTQTIRVWNPSTGRVLHSLYGGAMSLCFATLSDGTTILAAGGLDTVELWRIDDETRLDTLDVPSELTSLATHSMPDGSTLLAAGCRDGTVRTWRLGGQDDDSAPLIFDTTGVLPLTSLALGELPDGTPILAGGGDGGTLRVWNAVTGRLEHALAGHEGNVWSVAIGTGSAGGTVVASLDGRRTVRLWDAATGRHVYTFPEPADGVWFGNALSRGSASGVGHSRDNDGLLVWRVHAILPDGSTILADSADSAIDVLAHATDTNWRALAGHSDRVVAISIGALGDGTPILASGSLDGTVRLWDPVSGRLRHTLTGHTASVDSVAITSGPGGEAVASGSLDRTVRLWNARTGRHLQTIETPRNVNKVAISARNDQIRVVAQGPGFIRMWTIRLGGARPLRVTGSQRSSAVGLVGLAPDGPSPPLALLADLVAIIGGEQPGNEVLAPLAEHERVRRLQELGWPRDARVGLAALLLEDLPADPRYAAPSASQRQLHGALLGAIGTGAGPAEPVAVAVDELRAAADRVTEQVVTLLAVVGPDAVAADPVLPLRLRGRAGGLPVLGMRPRALLAELGGQRPAGATASSTRLVAGTTGISRRGSLTNLLHTQLALPNELRAHRFARGELLYRLHDAETETPPEPVTLVLDTSPPTFGPVETVLRLVAHAVTMALWAAHRDVHLVRVDEPDRASTIAAPDDLVALWSGRTLDPPALDAALATAARCGTRRTIVLTQHHLVREHPIVTTPGLRVLSTHVPGDEPGRLASGPFHIHLPPEPTRADITRAVASLLAPNPTEVAVRPTMRTRPAKTSARRPRPAAPPSRPSDRVIMLDEPIEDEVANRVRERMLRAAEADPTTDIALYIDSTGGSVAAGMAIYGTMQSVECDVATYATGLAEGIAQYLLSVGTPGKRHAVADARIVLRKLPNFDTRFRHVLADNEVLTLSADEALRHGLIDHIVTELDPPDPALVIPFEIIEAMFEHALAERPNIACGVVAGPAGADRPNRFIPMENAEHSPLHWEFDGQQWLRIYREMDARGEEPTVIYRCYTDGKARPAERDIAIMTNVADVDPGIIHHVFVSTHDLDDPEFCSYRLVNGLVIEEPVRLVPDQEVDDDRG